MPKTATPTLVPGHDAESGSASARHAAIVRHADALSELAELLTSPPAPDPGFASRFEAEFAFVQDTLLPQIEAVEGRLYPELERLLGDRRTMSPMRAEHREMRRLAGSLARYRPDVVAGRLGRTEAIGLRRVLYRLYAILKVHMAEEELYMELLERNLAPPELAALARALDSAMSQSF
jgi:Hemerythrin HHE cation binding domain